MSYRYGGETIPHDSPQVFLYTMREPLGVVGLITPWNFPIAIPAWKIAPALLAGNALVIKPSELAPALTVRLAQIACEAGVPKGVLNVVTGRGDAGAALSRHPKVVAISFTGSQAVGAKVNEAAARRMARTQLERGGKNPTIVLADANLDLAATLCIKAGFGLTGQACTATSRVIVDATIADDLAGRIVKQAKAIRVGNGLTAGVDMGPAVSEAQLEKDLAAIAHAKDEKADLLSGGRRVTEGDLAHGLFVEPTVFDRVTPAMRIAREEVFGPVLAIIRVSGFDEAIQVANAVDVGLSATLVTRDVGKAMRFTNAIDAGVVKVNQISTGLALQAPFGGVKGSSNDVFKEQGAAAVDFYSRIKSVYVDYSQS
jgi:aldehyde dehydrogenase (NAD+)